MYKSVMLYTVKTNDWLIDMDYICINLLLRKTQKDSWKKKRIWDKQMISYWSFIYGAEINYPKQIIQNIINSQIILF